MSHHLVVEPPSPKDTPIGGEGNRPQYGWGLTNAQILEHLGLELTTPKYG